MRKIVCKKLKKIAIKINKDNSDKIYNFLKREYNKLNWIEKTKYLGRFII